MAVLHNILKHPPSCLPAPLCEIFLSVLRALPGVWCLFEFLLSSQLNLDLVFGTDLGVLGEQGTSPDITLEIGRKLETLQVANCPSDILGFSVELPKLYP